MKGYKAVTHQRPEHNRGLVMWVKDYYHERMVRVFDPEDKNIRGDHPHFVGHSTPHKYYGDITSEQIEDARRVLRNKVKKCEESSQVCILMYMYMYNSWSGHYP